MQISFMTEIKKSNQVQEQIEKHKQAFFAAGGKIQECKPFEYSPSRRIGISSTDELKVTH